MSILADCIHLKYKCIFLQSCFAAMGWQQVKIWCQQCWQVVVTYISPLEMFTTMIKIFDWQNLCLFTWFHFESLNCLICSGLRDKMVATPPKYCPSLTIWRSSIHLWTYCTMIFFVHVDLCFRIIPVCYTLSRKEKIINEWINVEKSHKSADVCPMFWPFFHARVNLLKFDTTAGYSCHWSIVSFWNLRLCTVCILGDFPGFLSALASNNVFIM